VYQPGGGTYNAFLTASHLWDRYPSMGRYLARAYIVFDDVTDGDLQHYVVHQAAALAAAVAGNGEAAQEQELRAASHRPW
jgi:hypothetical protein